MDKKKRVHIFISGRVQGVFFRDSTRRKAISLGVTGWVRNLLDGRVEVVFEGVEEDVDVMVNWCSEGPPGARVTDVDIEEENYLGEFETFEIRW